MESCRDKDKRKIEELLGSDGGAMSLSAIAFRIHRGVAYTRSLCEESPAFEYVGSPETLRRGRVGDREVRLKRTRLA